MQEIVRITSEYPLAAIGIAFIAVVVFFFLFMKLVRIALIVLIVAFAVGGYFYLQYPDDRPASLSEALEKGEEVMTKGRELIDRGKEIYEKGRGIVDKGKGVLEKGIDKGKDATDEIGKIIGGEKGSGKR